MQSMTSPDGRLALVVDSWDIDIRSTIQDGKTLHHLKVSDTTAPVDLIIGNIDPISSAAIAKALQGGVVVVA